MQSGLVVLWSKIQHQSCASFCPSVHGALRHVGLAAFGHKELSLAGHGLLELLTCREEFGPVHQFEKLSINVSWKRWSWSTGGAPSRHLRYQVWMDTTSSMTMAETRSFLIHEDAELEAVTAVDGTVPDPENTTNPALTCVLSLLRISLDAIKWTRAKHCDGINEDTQATSSWEEFPEVIWSSTSSSTME